MLEQPLVTVISTNFNHGRFLKDTLDSVLEQTYPNIQHIVVDGASTDGSLDILKEYPHIELISESDDGPFDAFWKGLKRAKGKYIMQCGVTDGYLDKEWIEKCVTALEANLEISLVWGLPQHMSEDGELKDVCYPQFHKKDPPQKENFVYYWLSSFFWLPEGNFCVKKNIFKECFRLYDKEEYFKGSQPQFDPWLEFNYWFNSKGYLPYFIRSVANFGRIHGDQRGQQETQTGLATRIIRSYQRLALIYRRQIMRGGKMHIYRDSNGRSLAYQFSRNVFLFHYYFRPQTIISALRPKVRPIIKRVPGLERVLLKLRRFS